MAVDNDALAIDRAIDQLMEVSEEIGRITEQIEKVKDEQYQAVSQDIDDPTYQYQIDNLTCYRDELYNKQSRARTDVYEKFKNYYMEEK